MASTDHSSVRLERFESLMKRRFFYVPSSSIYEGRNAAGLYDLGPTSTALKSKIVEQWKAEFVYRDAFEKVFEFEGSSILPEAVLKASGHVDKFQDVLVRDLGTEECHRFDHLLFGAIEREVASGAADQSKLLSAKQDIAEGESSPEHCRLVQEKFQLLQHPDTGNELSKPFPFNLMFDVSVGPEGKQKAFLRPETAQGIFVNFQRFYDQAGSKLPFAVSCVGQAYRNEASPRQGLLRTREFSMAELEYFHWPDEKVHGSFSELAEASFPMLLNGDCKRLACGVEREDERGVGWLQLGDATRKGVISNELTAVYIARVLRFLQSIGVREDRVRFRKHESTELAHYSSECWDAEIYSDRYGWIECVGISDRACYDLKAHAKHTSHGHGLRAFRLFPEGPKKVREVVVQPRQPVFGKHFRKQAKSLQEVLKSLPQEEAVAVEAAIESGDESVMVTLPDGDSLLIPTELLSCTRRDTTASGVAEFPHVLEPSFGLGRILYCVLEHSFYLREDDENRGVLAIPRNLAPITCSLLPLSNDSELKEMVRSISKELSRRSVRHVVDDSSSSIGKRYARSDELGIPFAVTVDFESAGASGSNDPARRSIAEATVTIRERDSMAQKRCSVAALAQELLRRGQ